MLQKFLSFKGSLSRKEFLLCLVGVLVLQLIIGFALGAVKMIADLDEDQLETVFQLMTLPIVILFISRTCEIHS